MDEKLELILAEIRALKAEVELLQLKQQLVSQPVICPQFPPPPYYPSYPTYPIVTWCSTSLSSEEQK